MAEKEDKKKSKKDHPMDRSRAILKDMGIDPEQMARESKHELMVPKMALVGIFETIQKFSEIGKNTIIGAVGPLNVRALKVFILALRSSLDMADKTIQDYLDAQAILAAKETVEALARIFQEEEDKEQDPNGNIAPPSSPEEDDDSLDLGDLEPDDGDGESIAGEEELPDLPDEDDASGFGGSYSKFKKSGKLVN